MKPSHQHRLPVSKPSYGYRKRRNEQLLSPGGAEPSTDGSNPAISTGEATDKSFHHQTTQRENETSDSNPNLVYESSDLRAESTGIPPVESEPVIRIEVQKSEHRPFELGDLLTRDFIGRNNSFLVSFGLHTLMVFILSMFLIHGTGKAMIMLELLSSPDVEKDSGLVAEIDVDFDDSDKLLDAVSDDLFDNAFGDADTKGEKLAADGTAAGIDGDSQSGQGDGKSAKFFGTRYGNSFVYVLDRSGSMGSQTQGPNDEYQRFDVARSELMNSVQSLRPHQEFYVVMFSTSLKRMFDDDSLLSKPIKATPENKSRLRNWLSKVRADGGTDPRKGLTLAFKMKPDAIFMLSDGEFRDENKKGQPNSIDIVKKYIAENEPIKINSIALEDQRSKVNMQELADVSGGQFRFVRVNDFLGEVLNFRDKAQRMEVLQRLAGGLDSWTQKHEFATKELIPLLNDGDPQTQKKVEEILHQWSFGVFKTKIRSVAVPDSNGLNNRKKAMASWNQVWETANELKSPDMANDLGFFVAMATGTEDGFLKKIESIDAVSLPPKIQLALVRRVLDYQEEHGITQQTRQLLLDLYTELNKESTAKFGREHFLKNASQATCRARLDRVLSNRRIFARRMYRKWEDEKQTDEARQDYARKIVELYPETRYAEMMRANL